MMGGMRALPLAVLVLLSSCLKKPKPDIPVYPDAMGMQSKGTMQSADMALFNNKWMTSASLGEVRAFYEKALLSRPGWKVEGDARELVVFTDGNLKPTGELMDLIDREKGGGLVTIMNAPDRTLIDIWQAFPVKK